MRLLLLIFTGLSLRAVYSSAADCDLKTVDKIERALQSGKQILVLAWSDKDKCGDTDEACGDWADRLNEFASGGGKGFEMIKLSPKAWKRVVDIGASPIPAQSELFLKKNYPAYFYKGPILDLETYDAVINVWSNKIFSASQNSLPQKVMAKLCGDNHS